ncbi:MAG: hypothetical protein HGJ91_15315, partial [Desulfobacula sp.]|nr:hypothetical protein [Desulfobacula sp.]
MKKIRVEDAIGTVLSHDMTRIIRGKFKGVGFKKAEVSHFLSEIYSKLTTSTSKVYAKIYYKINWLWQRKFVFV